MPSLLLALVLVLALPPAPLLQGAPPAAGPGPSDGASRILADLQALDAVEGSERKAGTPPGEAAARLLATMFRKAGLLPGGDTGGYLQLFDLLPAAATPGPPSSPSPTKTRAANVVGLLPGSDRTLNTEVVVVGARWGSPGATASAPLSGEAARAPGQDDLSGVAALLELSRTLTPRRRDFRRSLVVAAFAAAGPEGTGSSRFAAHPPVPLDRMVAMVNLGPLGRGDGGPLHLHGLATSAAWRPLLERLLRPPGAALLHDDDGGRGDHVPFAAASRPVLFATTAAPEKPSPAGHPARPLQEEVASAASLLAPVVEALLNAPSPPPFSKAKGGPPPGPPAE